VVPTDTVYGLAARPDRDAAVRLIYHLKGRPEGMHLPVLAASVDQVRALGVAFTPAAAVLARRWWPGPLTMAFGFEPHRSRPGWLEGRAEVAVRIPDHDFLRALLEQTGVLVVTSANRHGAPTPRTARDVVTGLGSAVDFVLDGGLLEDIPSTLVNVGGPEPSVERAGAIAPEAIVGALLEPR
jgi:L-threonylcarbamoyladenylate synthase